MSVKSRAIALVGLTAGLGNKYAAGNGGIGEPSCVSFNLL